MKQAKEGNYYVKQASAANEGGMCAFNNSNLYADVAKKIILCRMNVREEEYCEKDDKPQKRKNFFALWHILDYNYKENKVR